MQMDGGGGGGRRGLELDSVQPEITFGAEMLCCTCCRILDNDEQRQHLRNNARYLDSRVELRWIRPGVACVYVHDAVYIPRYLRGKGLVLQSEGRKGSSLWSSVCAISYAESSIGFGKRFCIYMEAIFSLSGEAGFIPCAAGVTDTDARAG